MPQQEPIFEIKMQFPRRIIQSFRKRYPAQTIEESAHLAFEALCAQAGPGVHVSEKTMHEMSTILASGEITSEADLIRFARERFSMGENMVLLDIDPNLCYYIREVAQGEKISFAQAVTNYLHRAFAAGWFNEYMRESWVCFTTKEWKRMREILGKVPTTGQNLLRILEDWKMRRDVPVIPIAPQPEADGPKVGAAKIETPHVVDETPATVSF